MKKPIFRFALCEELQDCGDLFLPTKSEELSTGYDVRAYTPNRLDLIIKPFEYFKISLGFSSFCPTNWYYQLHPRSSSFTKKYMHNIIGIIDESWEGITLFAGQYLPNNNDNLVIKFADKIGQIIPIKRQDIVINHISNEEYNKLSEVRNGIRKDQGFGSTG